MPWDYRSWREAILASSLPLRAKMLAVVLNEHMPNAFPGIQLLQSRCSMSRSSVLRAIATLEEAGWLVVKRRNGSGSHYRLVGTVDQYHTDTGFSGTPVSAGHHTGFTQTPDQCQPDTAPVSAGHPKQDLKQDPKQKGKRNSARARKTQLPDDFAPNAGHQSLANELGVDLAKEFPQFRDHHQAKGTTMLRWDLALRTWLRNSAKWGGNGHSRRSDAQRTMDRQLERLRRLEAEEAQERAVTGQQ